MHLESFLGFSLGTTTTTVTAKRAVSVADRQIRHVLHGCHGNRTLRIRKHSRSSGIVTCVFLNTADLGPFDNLFLDLRALLLGLFTLASLNLHIMRQLRRIPSEVMTAITAQQDNARPTRECMHTKRWPQYRYSKS